MSNYGTDRLDRKYGLPQGSFIGPILLNTVYIIDFGCFMDTTTIL